MALGATSPMFLRYRHFLKFLDLAPTDLQEIVKTAITLKQLRRSAQDRPTLSRKDVALLFEGPSQTVCWSSSAACSQVGLRAHHFDRPYTGLGEGDDAACAAQRLGRLYSGLLLHGVSQEKVEEVARASGVPVFNLGNDSFEPLAVLADFVTMAESASKPLSELSLTFLGDGRSGLAQSLMVGAAKLGLDIRFCGPKEKQPDDTLTETCLALGAETGAQIRLYTDAEQAVKGSDFLYSHSWTDEPEKLTKKSVKPMLGYRVTSELISQTGNSRCRLLHHLPFHLHDDSEKTREAVTRLELYGLEVAAELCDSSVNLAYNQVENHLHACKAVLVSLFA